MKCPYCDHNSETEICSYCKAKIEVKKEKPKPKETIEEIKDIKDIEDK